MAPVASVVPVHVCALAAVPSVIVNVRPAIGVTPSCLRIAEKAVDWPFAITVGLVAVNATAVSSLVMLNVVLAELAAFDASPANVAVSVYEPAAWFGVIEQFAMPLAFVVPVHVSVPVPAPSTNMIVLPATGFPLTV